MKQTAIFLLLVICVGGYTQTSDTKYAMPLPDVVKDIEQRYGITIRDPENLIPGKTVTYAQWRYRVDVEQTLSNVLTPVDLAAQKEGDKKYKIKKYQNHRTTVEEGKKKLNYLAGLYHDQASWEKRKAELRPCIYKALQLDPLPSCPGTSPILSNRRTMNGYTIENIALETLPGLYVCGSIYRPLKIKGKAPLILCPNGHT